MAGIGIGAGARVGKRAALFTKVQGYLAVVA